jgi:hypothetical protein
MSISCDPASLVKAAKCFPCVPRGSRRWVKAYLLCQFANKPTIPAPPPLGFTFLPSDTTGVTVVATWAAPPAGVISTEVWTSTDNITYVLAATVASPGTTASLTYGGAGIKNYAKVRSVTAGGAGTFTAPIFIPGEVPVWIKAVITNGGAAVAQATCLAMNTFAIALVNAGIDTMMQSVNCYVPDNLTAALTPLYKTQGSDPWTNVNFIAGDLTVNGLTGNATTKVLDSGVVSTTAWQNTAGNINANTAGGISVYLFTTGTGASGADVGVASNAPSAEITLYGIFQPGVNNNTIFDFTNNGTDRISVLNTGFKGFLSANRTSPTAQAVYVASSGTPFATLGSNAFNTIGHAMPSQSFCVHGYKTTAAVRTPNSDRTISFAGLHIGLSSAQAQSLFNAVQALRTALGGGFV